MKRFTDTVMTLEQAENLKEQRIMEGYEDVTIVPYYCRELELMTGEKKLQWVNIHYTDNYTLNLTSKED